MKEHDMMGWVGGSYGPNDDGYINNAIRKAAKDLVWATDIWCEGHYAHSNARRMPSDHPLAIALRELCKVDMETAGYANKKHDPSLFVPHEPTEEALHRWDGSEGPKGISNESGVGT